MDISSLTPNISTRGELPRAPQFINPFCDIASEYIPSDLNTIFEFCEYLMLAVVPFRSVSQRVVRYFLTDVEFGGADDNQIEDCKSLVNDKLNIINALACAGDNYMTYGQAFVSLYFPFDRFFICKECGIRAKSSIVDYKFDSRKIEFSGKCAACKQKTVFEVDDIRSLDLDRVKFIHWNPKNIRMLEHKLSGQIKYYYKLDNDFVENIRLGKKFYLEDTPMSFIKACCDKKKRDNKKEVLFKFADDSLFVMKCESLAGLDLNGWGIPPILPNFKLAYYTQLLRRYDEAIALDRIIPDSILYPAINTTSGGMDALTTSNMETFTQQMKSMIENRRKNPFARQVAPFPVGQVTIGGDARQLSPKDNIAYALEELMNALGYPAELYTGSLKLEAFPVALRLFEKQWNVLVDGDNHMLSWTVRQVSNWFGWKNITAKLRSVTLADDLENKALALQAAAGRDISKETAYRPFGIDFLDEQRRVVSEEEEIAKLQQEAMERQQSMEQSPVGGGQEEAGPATPGMIHEQAAQLAQSLLFEVPENLRRGELIKIKHSNPTLHALVSQNMDEIRQEMSRQGQAMLMEEQKYASADDSIKTALKSLPSATRIKLLISDQLTEYTRKDLQKIAMDIKNNVEGAKKAFHFIYSNLGGAI